MSDREKVGEIFPEVREKQGVLLGKPDVS